MNEKIIENSNQIITKFGEKIKNHDEQFNTINQQFKKIIKVNVCDFGAKGDNISDDTEAFKKANNYAWTIARQYLTQNLVCDFGIQIYIPNGYYRLKGNKILGSIISDNIDTSLRAVSYCVEGEEATLVWEVTNVNDCLVKYDFTTTYPKFENIKIFSWSSSISVGGSIFNFESYKINDKWYGLASKGLFSRISIYPARENGISFKLQNVFKITGETMNDLAKVTNCSFNYFKNCLYSENSQAVGWTFDCNNFYGAYEDTVYFEFTRMNDTFNVLHNSFSLTKGQTVLKTNCPLDSNGKITETPSYGFNFDKNRIEVVEGDTYNHINICSMNFGTLYFSNTNLTLGSKGNTISRFELDGNARLVIDNVNSYTAKFTIPIIDDRTSGLGVFSNNSIILNNFRYSDFYYFYFKDKNGEYEFKEKITDSMFLTVKVNNIAKIGDTTSYDFEIVQNNPNLNSYFNVFERNYIKSNTGLANTIKYPTNQMLTNISISGVKGAPFSKFKIYFGRKENNKYVIVDNPGYLSNKNDFELWKGSYINLTNFWVNEEISVYAILNSDGQEYPLGGYINIKYCSPMYKLHGVTSLNTFHLETVNNVFNVGTNNEKPTSPQIGQFYFNKNYNKPSWWNGTNWVDGTGNTLV